MAMKTSIRKDGESVIVMLEGQLDFETNDEFRESLMRLESQTADNQVIFDLSQLQFVGSSGISAFVQTLREFNVRATHKPRYANVKSEFKRIIVAFDDNGSFEFCDSIKQFDN